MKDELESLGLIVGDSYITHDFFQTVHRKGDPCLLCRRYEESREVLVVTAVSKTKITVTMGPVDE